MLTAVQNIIQNTLASEDGQQQPTNLQGSLILTLTQTILNFDVCVI